MFYLAASEQQSVPWPPPTSTIPSFPLVIASHGKSLATPGSDAGPIAPMLKLLIERPPVIFLSLGFINDRICGHSPKAKFNSFLRMFRKPTTRTEICKIGVESELEGGMERIRVLSKFDIGMIDHLRKAWGNFGEKTIPWNSKKGDGVTRTPLKTNM